jgi:hypothetical protein
MYAMYHKQQQVGAPYNSTQKKSGDYIATTKNLILAPKATEPPGCRSFKRGISHTHIDLTCKVHNDAHVD